MEHVAVRRVTITITSVRCSMWRRRLLMYSTDTDVPFVGCDTYET